MRNNKPHKAVIMAGGAGTRLWPVSQKNKPKQFQAITSNKTMLQETYLRIRKKFATKDIYISTNSKYVAEVEREILEIPARNIIPEPMARGTASSIALVLAVLLTHDENSIVSVFPSDHLIKHENIFKKALDNGEIFIEEHPGETLIFGVVPTYPETGYGYIKQTEHNFGNAIYKVERFVEKPDTKKAKKYIGAGGYHWNSGIYIFDAQKMREKFARYAPNTSKRLDSIRSAIDRSDYDNVLTLEYQQMDKINFEYAIIENDSDIAVMPLALGWSDVGSWTSLKDTLVGTGKNHFVRGDHVDFDSENLLVYGSKKLITTIGVKDLIIVDTEDAILICHRDKSQTVSDVVKKLEASNKIDQR